MKGVLVRSFEIFSVCLLAVIWGNNFLLYFLETFNISFNFPSEWVIWRIFPKVLSILLVVGTAKLLYKANFYNLGLVPLSKKKWTRGFILGSASVVAILYVYAHIYQVPLEWGDRVGNPTFMVLGFLAIAFLAISEELLFRGFILPFITARWNVWAGIVLSSIFFGLFHIFNPGFNLVMLVVLIGVGIFYALYKLLLDRGGLWGVIGFHMAWNFTQEFLFKADLPKEGIMNILGMVVVFGFMIIFILISQTNRGEILESIKEAGKKEHKEWVV